MKRINKTITPFTVLILTLLFSLQLTAQDKPKNLEEGEHFIYLNNNKLLREGDYTVKKGLLLRRFYYLNGKKIKLKEMKYFQDSRGYFGVKNGYTLERTESGEIDLFFKIDYDGPINGSYSTRSKTYYYTKGFGDLKQLKYQDLMEDLELEKTGVGFNPKKNQILDLLEEGKRKRKTSIILLVGGIGTMLAGVLLSRPKEEMGDPKVLGIVVSGVGLVGTVTGLVIKPEKSYLKAIQEYNRLF